MSKSTNFQTNQTNFDYLDELCGKIVEMTRKALKAHDLLCKFDENWSNCCIINEKAIKSLIIDLIEQINE